MNRENGMRRVSGQGWRLEVSRGTCMQIHVNTYTLTCARNEVWSVSEVLNDLPFLMSSAMPDIIASVSWNVSAPYGCCVICIDEEVHVHGYARTV